MDSELYALGESCESADWRPCDKWLGVRNNPRDRRNITKFFKFLAQHKLSIPLDLVCELLAWCMRWPANWPCRKNFSGRRKSTPSAIQTPGIVAQVLSLVASVVEG